MTIMQYNEFIATLNRIGVMVFTISDAAKILGKTNQYTAKFLNNRKGLERIEKGKYCILGSNPDIVASHIVNPSYLSLITALRYYNLTTQLPKEKYVVSTLRHRRINFHGYEINFIKASSKLMFGYSIINGVSVATPEKAFIDTIYFKKGVWYKEEFETAMQRGVLDIEKLKGYAKTLGNRALILRLSDFLEKNYSINCDDIKAVGKFANPFDYAARKGEKTSKKKLAYA